jgi:hypothetical protein
VAEIDFCKVVRLVQGLVDERHGAHAVLSLAQHFLNARIIDARRLKA